MFQFITYRLVDALPAEVVARLESQLADLPDDERTRQRRQRIDEYIDRGAGSCCLRDPRCAQIVRDSWLHFAGERYDLCAWVVMPNHVHVLIRERQGYQLPDIVAAWKHFTATQINRLRGTSGHLWQNDHWDRYIRDEYHYVRTVAYIHGNPVKAGLVKEAEEWMWSSVTSTQDAPRSGALPGGPCAS